MLVYKQPTKEQIEQLQQLEREKQEREKQEKLKRDKRTIAQSRQIGLEKKRLREEKLREEAEAKKVSEPEKKEGLDYIEKKIEERNQFYQTKTRSGLWDLEKLKKEKGHQIGYPNKVKEKTKENEDMNKYMLDSLTKRDYLYYSRYMSENINKNYDEFISERERDETLEDEEEARIRKEAIQIAEKAKDKTRTATAPQPEPATAPPRRKKVRAQTPRQIKKAKALEGVEVETAEEKKYTEKEIQQLLNDRFKKMPKGEWNIPTVTENITKRKNKEGKKKKWSPNTLKTEITIKIGERIGQNKEYSEYKKQLELAIKPPPETPTKPPPVEVEKFDLDPNQSVNFSDSESVVEGGVGGGVEGGVGGGVEGGVEGGVGGGVKDYDKDLALAFKDD